MKVVGVKKRLGIPSIDEAMEEYPIDEQELWNLLENIQVGDLDEDAVEPVSNAVGLDSLPENHLHLLSRDDVLELERVRHEVALSPYDRFRARKGRLSVTDLVSPSWCEVQFQYSLEKGGRKRRTAAMKEGGKIHSDLEREVHVVVPFAVDEAIPEEVFGLRLLNMLVGLSELAKGITRELPVLGFVGDVLVHGIIDELQRIPGRNAFMRRPVIISDSKTRVRFSEPSTTQAAQAKHQVMVYLQLLRDLGNIDMQKVLDAEGYDGHRAFSDSFFAQSLSMLEDNTANTILDLWAVLQPQLIELKNDLQGECRVLYIHQGTKKVIAERRFQFDPIWMQDRNGRTLDWWHGRREAEGVTIEEAFKCRYCEMEPGCSWRLQKVEEIASRKNRL